MTMDAGSRWSFRGSHSSIEESLSSSRQALNDNYILRYSEISMYSRVGCDPSNSNLTRPNMKAGQYRERGLGWSTNVLLAAPQHPHVSECYLEQLHTLICISYSFGAAIEIPNESYAIGFVSPKQR